MWNPQETSGLGGHLAAVIERSRVAVEHVTEALSDSGPSAADALQSAEKALYALRRAVDDQALAIEETRDAAPAGAVRAILAAAQVNADAECVAGLAKRLAEIAGSRPSRPAMPAEVRAVVSRMGRVCADLMATAGGTGATPAGTEARIEAAGAEVGRLRRRLDHLLLHEPAPVDVDAALDAALACRYYTHCAELAGSMARHASGQARQ
ncbi:hypothetical protein GCM10009827_067640 [Dactylosporangium maewongense]|uniref:Uncharacterized protein n=1 Tax=Dactylosporangium maewongense TaxID=634393 RepID=A0ABP4M749_9ACTN